MVEFEEKPSNNKDVFRYSSASNPSEKVGTMWFYELTFYDGFAVKGFTIPNKPQTPN
jgi:hypothetical protein